MLFEQSFLGVVSIAQLVEMTDSAVLGDVVEVVSSIPAVGHKIFFSIFRQIVFQFANTINTKYQQNRNLHCDNKKIVGSCQTKMRHNDRKRPETTPFS